MLAVLLLAVAFLAGCAALPPHDAQPYAAAVPADPSTRLGRIVQASNPGDPASSGLRLLHDGSGALAARLDLIRAAQRSIDLQVYELRDDASGRLVLRELRDATRRGVRVRVLLDDLHTQGLDPLLVGFASYPGAELRLFNPFPTRGGLLSRFAAAALDIDRIHRRMHNKLLVVDGALAIVGGRNIGDGYFQASDRENFFDLDAVVAGAVVPQLASLFDVYWNSRVAWPVAQVARLPGDAAALRAHFDDCVADDRVLRPPAPPAIDRLGWPPLGNDLARGLLTLSWGIVQAYADPPGKALGRGEARQLPTGAELANLRHVVGEEMQRAHREIWVTSPYFLPGDRALPRMRTHIARGVSISILTNSMASSDEPVVHGAYRRYRDNMLREGVKLFELSLPHSTRLLMEGAPDVPLRLHTKSIVIDEQVAYIGSLNLDPRSDLHNTELGLLAYVPRLAQDMHRLITLYKHEAAYELRLVEGSRHRLEWWRLDEDIGVETLDDEPHVDRWTRLKVDVLSWFVPEDWL